MRRIRKNSIYDVYCISAIGTIFFLWEGGGGGGVVSIAQLVEVKVSAVLGGVAEVVSSTVVHKNIFQHLPA